MHKLGGLVEALGLDNPRYDLLGRVSNESTSSLILHEGIPIYLLTEYECLPLVPLIRTAYLC